MPTVIEPPGPSMEVHSAIASALADNPKPDSMLHIHAATVQASCNYTRTAMFIHAACVQVAIRADHRPDGSRYSIEETPGAEDDQVIYHDLFFPRCISYGSTGSPNYTTEKVEVDSGAEQRNQRRAYPRHSYKINMENVPADEIAEIMNLWHVCAGDYIGFLFLDPLDHTSANDGDSIASETTDMMDQHVAQAVGSKSEYELFKYYRAGLHERKRRIRYPDEETLEVAVNGQRYHRWEYDYVKCVLRFLRPWPVARSFTVSRAADGTITGGDFSTLAVGDLVYLTGFSVSALNAPAGGDPARVVYSDATSIRLQRMDGTNYGADVIASANIQVWSALPPTGAEIRAGFYFYVPVRFESGDNMEGEIKTGLRESAQADFSQITLREVFE